MTDFVREANEFSITNKLIESVKKLSEGDQRELFSPFQD